MNAKTPLGWTKKARSTNGAHRQLHDLQPPLSISGKRIRGAGSDLARTVALFRQVDTSSRQARQSCSNARIAKEDSVEYLRADEAAVMETISKVLADTTTAQNPDDPHPRVCKSGPFVTPARAKLRQDLIAMRARIAGETTVSAAHTSFESQALRAGRTQIPEILS